MRSVSIVLLVAAALALTADASTIRTAAAVAKCGTATLCSSCGHLDGCQWCADGQGSCVPAGSKTCANKVTNDYCLHDGIAVSLEHVANIHKDQSISYLGSMLFTRGVSGTRVADNSRVKTIGDHKFTCWGQNSNIYPVPYLTVAVSVGTTKRDIDEFIQRLDKALEKFCDQAREKEIKLKKEKEGNVDKEGVVLDGL